MSKTRCKEKCEFLKDDSPGKEPRCVIYNKKLKFNDGYVRLKRCVRESRDYKINMQVNDLKDFYDAFVCEMDIMFDSLYKLIKGEDKDGET